MKKNYSFITNKKMEESVVTQSNKLTMSRQVLGLSCRKLVYLIIYKIRQRKISELDLDINDQFVLSIPIKELKSYGVISRSNDLVNILKELKMYANKELTIDYCEYDNKGGLKRAILIDWISGFIYEDSELSIFLNKVFIRLFVQQKKNFTMFNPLMPITFKSVYTQRFFEICHRYENYRENIKSNPIIKVNDLITMFGLESNKSYKKNIYDFERRVIMTAQNELFDAVDEGRSDISFRYKRFKINDEYMIELIIIPSNRLNKIHTSCKRISNSVVKLCSKYIKNQNKRLESFGEYISGLSLNKSKEIKKRIENTIERYEDKSNPEIAKILSSVIKEEYGI